jgi:hypothetical protein
VQSLSSEDEETIICCIADIFHCSGPPKMRKPAKSLGKTRRDSLQMRASRPVSAAAADRTMGYDRYDYNQLWRERAMIDDSQWVDRR